MWLWLRKRLLKHLRQVRARLRHWYALVHLANRCPFLDLHGDPLLFPRFKVVPAHICLAELPALNDVAKLIHVHGHLDSSAANIDRQWRLVSVIWLRTHRLRHKDAVYLAGNHDAPAVAGAPPGTMPASVKMRLRLSSSYQWR